MPRIKQPSRRDRLIADNPFCILCGGIRKAEEEEHAPGRNFFDAKQWPEGFSFPGCICCNRLTRNDEQLVAFLTRWPNARTEADLQDLKKRLSALLNNCPEVKRKTPISDNKMRHELQARSLPRIPGIPLRQHPIFVKKSEYMPAIYRVGFKIGAGLHWNHANKRVIPPDGGCYVDMYTESDKVLSAHAKAIWATIATGLSVTMRNGKSLSDQFNYEFGEKQMRDNGDQGLYIVHFRNSLTMTLIVFCKPELFHGFKDSLRIPGGWLQPFSWPN